MTHDELCMGSIAFGVCDCAMIKKIRNNQHEKSYVIGYNDAKIKYKAKFKKRLKKIKNEAR